MERSQIEAEARIKTEIAGKICAVCFQDKWEFFSFCRDCSLRLQRASLTDALGSWDPKSVANSGRERNLRTYDIARDFLIQKRR